MTFYAFPKPPQGPGSPPGLPRGPKTPRKVAPGQIFENVRKKIPELQGGISGLSEIYPGGYLAPGQRGPAGSQFAIEVEDK